MAAFVFLILQCYFTFLFVWNVFNLIFFLVAVGDCLPGRHYLVKANYLSPW